MHPFAWVSGVVQTRLLTGTCASYIVKHYYVAMRAVGCKQTSGARATGVWQLQRVGVVAC